ncbi:MAG: hypothetical protein NC412_05915 [Roseburia sp.]|nr:hypothetical protein [Roseburia sp.]
MHSYYSNTERREQELYKSGSLSELKIRLTVLHDSVTEIVEQKFEKFSINKKENIDWFKEVQEHELKEKLFILYKSIIGEAGKLFREYGYKDVSGESSKGHPAFGYTQHGTTITGPEPKNEALLDAQRKWLNACKIYVEVMEQMNREKAVSERKKRLIYGARLEFVLFTENGG